MIVIGLMSGTSADGIDAAVVRLEATRPSLTWEVLGHSHHTFTRELRAEIDPHQVFMSDQARRLHL